MIGEPFSLESVTFLPSWSWSVKSGAGLPTSTMTDLLEGCAPRGLMASELASRRATATILRDGRPLADARKRGFVLAPAVSDEKPRSLFRPKKRETRSW